MIGTALREWFSEPSSSALLLLDIFLLAFTFQFPGDLPQCSVPFFLPCQRRLNPSSVAFASHAE
jgi:hypothetical protein